MVIQPDFLIFICFMFWILDFSSSFHFDRRLFILILFRTLHLLHFRRRKSLFSSVRRAYKVRRTSHWHSVPKTRIKIRLLISSRSTIISNKPQFEINDLSIISKRHLCTSSYIWTKTNPILFVKYCLSKYMKNAEEI